MKTLNPPASAGKTVYTIQHADENVSLNRMSALLGGPENVLLRSSFATHQGEGPFAGRPAFFYRFGGCNVGDKTTACEGCDTDFRVGQSKVVSVQALADLYLQSSQPALIVITGGEPLLHLDLPEILVLLEQALASDPRTIQRPRQYQIETNGLLGRDNIGMLLSDNVTVVCSPKSPRLELSAPHIFLTREYLGSLDNFEEDGFRFHLKLVVSADPNDAYHELPSWLDGVVPAAYSNVWLSPVTVYRRQYDGEVASAWDPELIDVPRTQANYAYAARLASQRGFNLSMQQHLFFNQP